MKRTFIAAALACAASPPAPDAAAHAVAGDRLFPVTLTIDDPGVADEASVPTFTWQRSGANGGPGPADDYGFGFEYDKRITPDTALVFNDALIVTDTLHDKSRIGWQDVVLTAKWTPHVDPEHEFIVSLGLIRELGRTGTGHIGADQYGFTQPTVYFGKGLGDLPAPALRPFAISGELGWAIADKELKAAPDGGLDNGYANRATGGFSVQYSMPYRNTQVAETGLPDVFNHLVPLVEVAWSSPLNRPSNLGTQLVVSPGAIYLGPWFQVGVEALIPANAASGTHVGVIAQFHLFLDDLLPESLGRPLFDF